MRDYSADFSVNGIYELGNAWIQLGNDLQAQAGTMSTAMHATGWTGDGGLAAVTAFEAVHTHVLTPAWTTCWTIGDAINDYGRAIHTIQVKEAEAIAAANLAELIAGFIGLVLPIGLGLLAKLIAPLISGLMDSLTAIIAALSTAMQAVVRVIGFLAGVVGAAATQLGIDLLSQWIADLVYDVPFEIDWKSEGINMGIAGGLGAILGAHQLFPNGGAGRGIKGGGTPVPKIDVPTPNVAGAGEHGSLPGGIHEGPAPVPPALHAPPAEGIVPPIGGELRPNVTKPVDPGLTPGSRPPVSPPGTHPGSPETPVFGHDGGSPPPTTGRPTPPGETGAPRPGNDPIGNPVVSHGPDIVGSPGKGANSVAGNGNQHLPGSGDLGLAPAPTRGGNPAAGHVETQSPTPQRTTVPESTSRSVTEVPAASAPAPGRNVPAPTEPGTSTGPAPGTRASESPNAQNYKSSFEQQPREMGKGTTGDGTSTPTQVNPASPKPTAAADPGAGNGTGTGTGKQGIASRNTELPQAGRGTARSANEAPGGTNSTNTPQKTATGPETTAPEKSANTSVSAKEPRDGSGTPAKGGDGKAGENASAGRPGLKAVKPSPRAGETMTIADFDKPPKAAKEPFPGKGDTLGSGAGTKTVKAEEPIGPLTERAANEKARLERTAPRTPEAQQRVDAAAARHAEPAPAPTPPAKPGPAVVKPSPKAGEVMTVADLGRTPRAATEPFPGKGDTLGSGATAKAATPEEPIGPLTEKATNDARTAPRTPEARQRYDAAGARRAEPAPEPGLTAVKPSPKAGEMMTIADLGRTPKAPATEPFSGEGHTLGSGPGAGAKAGPSTASSSKPPIGPLTEEASNAARTAPRTSEAQQRYDAAAARRAEPTPEPTPEPGLTAVKPSPKAGEMMTIADLDKAPKAPATEPFSGKGHTLGSGPKAPRPNESADPNATRTAPQNPRAQKRYNAAAARQAEPTPAPIPEPGLTAVKPSPRAGESMTIADLDKAPKAPATEPFSGKGHTLGSGSKAGKPAETAASAPNAARTAPTNRAAQQRFNAAAARQAEPTPTAKPDSEGIAPEAAPVSRARKSPRGGQMGTFADFEPDASATPGGSTGHGGGDEGGSGGGGGGGEGRGGGGEGAGVATRGKSSGSNTETVPSGRVSESNPSRTTQHEPSLTENTRSTDDLFPNEGRTLGEEHGPMDPRKAGAAAEARARAYADSPEAKARAQEKREAEAQAKAYAESPEGKARAQQKLDAAAQAKANEDARWQLSEDRRQRVAEENVRAEQRQREKLVQDEAAWQKLVADGRDKSGGDSGRLGDISLAEARARVDQRVNALLDSAARDYRGPSDFDSIDRHFVPLRREAESTAWRELASDLGINVGSLDRRGHMPTFPGHEPSAPARPAPSGGPGPSARPTLDPPAPDTRPGPHQDAPSGNGTAPVTRSSTHVTRMMAGDEKPAAQPPVTSEPVEPTAPAVPPAVADHGTVAAGGVGGRVTEQELRSTAATLAKDTTSTADMTTSREAVPSRKELLDAGALLKLHDDLYPDEGNLARKVPALQKLEALARTRYPAMRARLSGGWLAALTHELLALPAHQHATPPEIRAVVDAVAAVDGPVAWEKLSELLAPHRRPAVQPAPATTPGTPVTTTPDTPATTPDTPVVSPDAAVVPPEALPAIPESAAVEAPVPAPAPVPTAEPGQRHILGPVTGADGISPVGIIFGKAKGRSPAATTVNDPTTYEWSKPREKPAEPPKSGKAAKSGKTVKPAPIELKRKTRELSEISPAPLFLVVLPRTAYEDFDADEVAEAVLADPRVAELPDDHQLLLIGSGDLAETLEFPRSIAQATGRTVWTHTVTSSVVKERIRVDAEKKEDWELGFWIREVPQEPGDAPAADGIGLPKVSTMVVNETEEGRKFDTGRRGDEYDHLLDSQATLLPWNQQSGGRAFYSDSRTRDFERTRAGFDATSPHFQYLPLDYEKTENSDTATDMTPPVDSIALVPWDVTKPIYTVFTHATHLAAWMPTRAPVKEGEKQQHLHLPGTSLGTALSRRPSLRRMPPEGQILLCACQAGAKGANGVVVAQQVADSTNHVVWASTTSIYIFHHRPDVPLGILRNEDGTPGRWVKFVPGGTSATEQGSYPPAKVRASAVVATKSKKKGQPKKEAKPPKSGLGKTSTSVVTEQEAFEPAARTPSPAPGEGRPAAGRESEGKAWADAMDKARLDVRSQVSQQAQRQAAETNARREREQAALATRPTTRPGTAGLDPFEHVPSAGVAELGDQRVVFAGSGGGFGRQWTAARYPWLTQVNPARDDLPEAGTNCVLSAISTDISLAEGEGWQAPPTGLSPVEHLVNYTGVPPVPVGSYGEVVDLVIRAGLGARGLLVIGTRSDPIAHVVNVVHEENETVVFLDGQTGHLAHLPEHPEVLRFSPTSGGFPAHVATSVGDVEGSVIRSLGASRQQPAGQGPSGQDVVMGEATDDEATDGAVTDDEEMGDGTLPTSAPPAASQAEHPQDQVESDGTPLGDIDALVRSLTYRPTQSQMGRATATMELRLPRSFRTERDAQTLRHISIRLFTGIGYLQEGGQPSVDSSGAAGSSSSAAQAPNEDVEMSASRTQPREVEVQGMLINGRLVFATNYNSSIDLVENYLKKGGTLCDLLESEPPPSERRYGKSLAEARGRAERAGRMITDDALRGIPSSSAGNVLLAAREGGAQAVVVADAAAGDTARGARLFELLTHDRYENTVILIRHPGVAGRQASMHAEQKLLAALHSAGITSENHQEYITGDIVVRGRKRPCAPCWAALKHYQEAGFSLRFNENLGRYFKESAESVVKYGSHMLRPPTVTNGGDGYVADTEPNWIRDALEIKLKSSTMYTTGFSNQPIPQDGVDFGRDGQVTVPHTKNTDTGTFFYKSGTGAWETASEDESEEQNEGPPDSRLGGPPSQGGVPSTNTRKRPRNQTPPPQPLRVDKKLLLEAIREKIRAAMPEAARSQFERHLNNANERLGDIGDDAWNVIRGLIAGGTSQELIGRALGISGARVSTLLYPKEGTEKTRTLGHSILGEDERRTNDRARLDAGGMADFLRRTEAAQSELNKLNDRELASLDELLTELLGHYTLASIANHLRFISHKTFQRRYQEIHKRAQAVASRTHDLPVTSPPTKARRVENAPPRAEVFLSDQQVSSLDGNFTVENLPADGDCFFHALIRLAGPSLADVPGALDSRGEVTVRSLRTLFARHVVSHQYLYREFLAVGDLEVVQRSMETMGSYASLAGDFMPLVAANVLGREIDIVEADGAIQAFSGSSPDDRPPLTLVRVTTPADHYMAAIPVVPTATPAPQARPQAPAPRRPAPSPAPRSAPAMPTSASAAHGAVPAEVTVPQARPPLMSPDEWARIRTFAPVARVDTERFDPLTGPSSRPQEPSAAPPRGPYGNYRPELEGYETRIVHDVRRFEARPGQWVREFTLRLHLRPEADSALDAEAVNRLWDTALDAVGQYFNSRFRLRGGDQVHLNLELTAEAGEAHQTIEVRPGAGQSNQLQWFAESTPGVLLHELMHFLGLPDEYAEALVALRRTDPFAGENGVMGQASNAADFAVLTRHLQRIEDVSRSGPVVRELSLDQYRSLFRTPDAYSAVRFPGEGRTLGGDPPSDVASPGERAVAAAERRLAARTGTAAEVGGSSAQAEAHPPVHVDEPETSDENVEPPRIPWAAKGKGRAAGTTTPTHLADGPASGTLPASEEVVPDDSAIVEAPPAPVLPAGPLPAGLAQFGLTELKDVAQADLDAVLASIRGQLPDSLAHLSDADSLFHLALSSEGFKEVFEAVRGDGWAVTVGTGPDAREVVVKVEPANGTGGDGAEEGKVSRSHGDSKTGAVDQSDKANERPELTIAQVPLTFGQGTDAALRTISPTVNVKGLISTAARESTANRAVQQSRASNSTGYWHPVAFDSTWRVTVRRASDAGTPVTLTGTPGGLVLKVPDHVVRAALQAQALSVPATGAAAAAGAPEAMRLPPLHVPEYVSTGDGRLLRDVLALLPPEFRVVGGGAYEALRDFLGRPNMEASFEQLVNDVLVSPTLEAAGLLGASRAVVRVRARLDAPQLLGRADDVSMDNGTNLGTENKTATGASHSLSFTLGTTVGWLVRQVEGMKGNGSYTGVGASVNVGAGAKDTHTSTTTTGANAEQGLGYSGPTRLYSARITYDIAVMVEGRNERTTSVPLDHGVRVRVPDPGSPLGVHPSDEYQGQGPARHLTDDGLQAGTVLWAGGSRDVLDLIAQRLKVKGAGNPAGTGTGEPVGLKQFKENANALRNLTTAVSQSGLQGVFWSGDSLLLKAHTRRTAYAHPEYVQVMIRPRPAGPAVFRGTSDSLEVTSSAKSSGKLEGKQAQTRSLEGGADLSVTFGLGTDIPLRALVPKVAGKAAYEWEKTTTATTSVGRTQQAVGPKEAAVFLLPIAYEITIRHESGASEELTPVPAQVQVLVPLDLAPIGEHPQPGAVPDLRRDAGALSTVAHEQPSVPRGAPTVRLPDVHSVVRVNGVDPLPEGVRQVLLASATHEQPVPRTTRAGRSYDRAMAYLAQVAAALPLGPPAAGGYATIASQQVEAAFNEDTVRANFQRILQDGYGTGPVFRYGRMGDGMDQARLSGALSNPRIVGRGQVELKNTTTGGNAVRTAAKSGSSRELGIAFGFSIAAQRWTVTPGLGVKPYTAKSSLTKALDSGAGQESSVTYTGPGLLVSLDVTYLISGNSTSRNVVTDVLGTLAGPVARKQLHVPGGVQVWIREQDAARYFGLNPVGTPVGTAIGTPVAAPTDIVAAAAGPSTAPVTPPVQLDLPAYYRALPTATATTAATPAAVPRGYSLADSGLGPVDLRPVVGQLRESLDQLPSTWLTAAAAARTRARLEQQMLLLASPEGLGGLFDVLTGGGLSAHENDDGPFGRYQLQVLVRAELSDPRFEPAQLAEGTTSTETTSNASTGQEDIAESSRGLEASAGLTFSNALQTKDFARAGGSGVDAKYVRDQGLTATGSTAGKTGVTSKPGTAGTASWVHHVTWNVSVRRVQGHGRLPQVATLGISQLVGRWGDWHHAPPLTVEDGVRSTTPADDSTAYTGSVPATLTAPPADFVLPENSRVLTYRLSREVWDAVRGLLPDTLTAPWTDHVLRSQLNAAALAAQLQRAPQAVYRIGGLAGEPGVISLLREIQVRTRLRNPRVVSSSATLTLAAKTEATGGDKARITGSQGANVALQGTATFQVATISEGGNGPGGADTWTPSVGLPPYKTDFTREGASEASAKKKGSSSSDGLTYLIQADTSISLTGLGNWWGRGGQRDVNVPGGVFFRTDERGARALGLLPAVPEVVVEPAVPEPAVTEPVVSEPVVPASVVAAPVVPGPLVPVPAEDDSEPVVTPAPVVPLIVPEAPVVTTSDVTPSDVTPPVVAPPVARQRGVRPEDARALHGPVSSPDDSEDIPLRELAPRNSTSAPTGSPRSTLPPAAFGPAPSRQRSAPNAPAAPSQAPSSAPSQATPRIPLVENRALLRGRLQVLDWITTDAGTGLGHRGSGRGQLRYGRGTVDSSGLPGDHPVQALLETSGGGSGRPPEVMSVTGMVWDGDGDRSASAVRALLRNVARIAGAGNVDTVLVRADPQTGEEVLEALGFRSLDPARSLWQGSAEHLQNSLPEEPADLVVDDCASGTR
ncbi:toxin glutamine deamidase domain-containing protein [Streptomyces sp. H39-S7]|uniref:toxin glutamine deamidase domain-containing protein n=1 Tax=Streptomyces sp. H39-S7 TaxID=3004357 RepID=UPI0022AF5B48|nr:toxin glutamine deamidase domain-containing protein [Streptomyces sp. H39-S7]MCZ4124822.1 toxin glutamine deamidase domain-containing protein [Streptomyces sp. H39-S7]